MSPNYFFVSKFIILTFIDKLFFILHILIDNNDFLLVLEVSLVKKIVEVQIELIFDMSPNYFGLQIHYLDFYLQAFFYFAYYDRKQWFLVGTGGFSRLNFFSVLLSTYLQIFFCLQIRFIDLGSLTFCFLTFLYYFITFYLLFIT